MQLITPLVMTTMLTADQIADAAISATPAATACRLNRLPREGRTSASTRQATPPTSSAAADPQNGQGLLLALLPRRAQPQKAETWECGCWAAYWLIALDTLHWYAAWRIGAATSAVAATTSAARTVGAIRVVMLPLNLAPMDAEITR